MKREQQLFLFQRILKDRAANTVMKILTFISLLTLVIMGGGLLYKSSAILSARGVWDLITGTEWSPLSGQFGFWPFILSSIYVTILAVLIGVPISLLAALYLTENAKAWVKKAVFPVLDILAGIPSVVYGLWGTLIIVPWIADRFAPHFVEYSSGYTLLAGGIVLSVMIIPLLVSLFVEMFLTIPSDLKDASASLGATRWQTSRLVVIRKASPGIIAAIVLSVSKAFGETLAVLMVCGNMVGIPHSLFDSAYPLSALIANNYGEMLSLPMYESALMFAALIMFVIIFVFNVIARTVLQRVEKKFKL
ncbi:MAG: phosphate ABC transporter permease subunit PstC [Dysgonamonadaceae bacterium]|jgi:phosphate transport system permease protein|nr:phosphate ABC transporter permease subunit PstC [Dysgonamonadaceae bacterium]